MTRKRHNTVCQRGPGPGEQFHVTRVTLQTPELGAWDVFEWALLNRHGILDRGSYPASRPTDYAGMFHSERDVFDHLDYIFVRQHEYECALDGPSDADAGL